VEALALVTFFIALVLWIRVHYLIERSGKLEKRADDVKGE
jgi:hypothetical protein